MCVCVWRAVVIRESVCVCVWRAVVIRESVCVCVCVCACGEQL